MHCLQCFSPERILSNHNINMPKPNTYIKFENHKKHVPVPFVICADFEAMTEKISGCQPSDENHTQTNIKNMLIEDMGIK